jgi:hypothetical protein
MGGALAHHVSQCGEIRGTRGRSYGGSFLGCSETWYQDQPRSVSGPKRLYGQVTKSGGSMALSTCCCTFELHTGRGASHPAKP